MTSSYPVSTAGPFDPLDPAPGSTRRKRYDAFISYNHDADGTLAPRIQRGLEAIAKPLLKRRAVDVFRDQTGLPGGGELWPKISAAMDGAEHFILLCSVGMATPNPDKPDWVGREIARWRATKDVGRIILVLTDGPPRRAEGGYVAEPPPARRGGLAWSEARNDFDRARSPSLHPSLFGAFAREPLFIDLSFARDEPSMSLEHSEFRTGIGTLAAPLRGLEPGDLFGEDVKIHRRTRRLVASAVTVLTLLTVTAIIAGAIAVLNGQEALRQRNTATSRELAAQSQAWTGPRALLLAAESHLADDTDEAKSALLSAIDDPATARTSDDRSHLASFSHAGDLVAATAALGGGQLASLDEDGLLSSWPAVPRAARTTAWVDGDLLAFAGDTHIAVGRGSQLTWVDAATGEVTGTTELEQPLAVLASDAAGVLAGTRGGAIARITPDTGPPALVADQHIDAISLIRVTERAVVTADDSGRIVTRDPGTLAPLTTVTVTGQRFTDVTADAATIVGPGSYDADRGLTVLAAAHAIATGEPVGELVTTDLVVPVDVLAAGSADTELTVLTHGADGGAGDPTRAAFYRGMAGAGATPITAEAADVEGLGDSTRTRIAHPERPTGFLRDVPAGWIAVTGTNATVASARDDATLADHTGAQIGYDWLAGPTVPLSVAPATGQLLTYSQDGLQLADLNALVGGAVDSGEPVPVTALGLQAQTGWLTPDGGHVLAGLNLSETGVLAAASAAGAAWLVPAPEFSVVPAATEDGAWIAFAEADVLAPSRVHVVNAATGEITATITTADALCAPGCTTLRASSLALSADARHLAVRTAAVEASTGYPPRAAVPPHVVLYDLAGGEQVPAVGVDPNATWEFPAPTRQGPVSTGAEVARYAASTSSVPTFGSDGLLRFHNGVSSIIAVDPADPGQPAITSSLAGGPWVLDEHGVPVAAGGCGLVVLDADLQAVGGTPNRGERCNEREIGWISASRTLVVDGSSLLPTDGAALRELACALAGRNLTESEWAQFLGDAPYRATCPGLPTTQPTPRVTPLPAGAATPRVTPSAAATETITLDRIIVQPGLPDPPNEVSELTGFPGREELLGFLRSYLGRDGIGAEQAEGYACFMPGVAPPPPETVAPPPPPEGVTTEPEPAPEPTASAEPYQRNACLGLVRADSASLVAVDFVGDEARQWLLLEPDGEEWTIAADFWPPDGDPAPAWVNDLLRS